MIFIAFLVLLGVVVLALSKANNAESSANELNGRLIRLENEVRRLREATPTPPPPRIEPAIPPVPAEQKPQAPEPLPTVTPAPMMPPPFVPEPRIPPPTRPLTEPVSPPPQHERAAQPSSDWEQFMGAKLFAWIGGLALFLGIAFFIKYSFDHNLIPPALRAAAGFAAGLALIAGGLLMKRKETEITAQTLCATGVLVLYGVSFACHSLYHFGWATQGMTFALMTLITATAFGLSVRLETQVIAVLGIAGGFLTPCLLSNGQDAPLALFGYIALLDIGLLAVALRRGWSALPLLGSLGTVLMQFAWTARFFIPHHYDTGYRPLIPMAILLGFQALFLTGTFAGRRLERDNSPLATGALVTALSSLLGAFFFLFFRSLAHAPALFFPFVMLMDLGWIAFASLDRPLAKVETVIQWAVFLILGLWVHFYATLPLLAPALAAGAAFALLHYILPWLTDRTVGTYRPLLPYLLLMALTRLPLADPTLLFGTALLLAALLLGVAAWKRVDSLPAVALLGVAALEQLWQIRHFVSAHPMPSFGWHLLFYAIFTLFPFLFYRRFAERTGPWKAAAMAGPVHFYLLYHLVESAYPNLKDAMGLLPAAFALPALLGTAVLARMPQNPARPAQLAWWGGVALAFLTLIFPVQFERQWITLGWALEGAALCWYYRRVPHPGVRTAGVLLLCAAFARLALNPAVLCYHARAALPLWNWYLYAYGITIACLFAAALLLAPPRHEAAGIHLPALLWSLGTALAFLLVNIEIADAFTPPGNAVLTFQFSGNLPRDLSYSIAWALFALMLLCIGMKTRLAPVRYAGIGLFAATLLKLFLHDLSQLDQLYRIAAFIGVAAVAIFASFLYQRFLGFEPK